MLPISLLVACSCCFPLFGRQVETQIVLARVGRGCQPLPLAQIPLETPSPTTPIFSPTLPA